jgi:hypothetical protein
MVMACRQPHAYTHTRRHGPNQNQSKLSRWANRHVTPSAMTPATTTTAPWTPRVM